MTCNGRVFEQPGRHRPIERRHVLDRCECGSRRDAQPHPAEQQHAQGTSGRKSSAPTFMMHHASPQISVESRQALIALPGNDLSRPEKLVATTGRSLPTLEKSNGKNLIFFIIPESFLSRRGCEIKRKHPWHWSRAGQSQPNRYISHGQKRRKQAWSRCDTRLRSSDPRSASDRRFRFPPHPSQQR